MFIKKLIGFLKLVRWFHELLAILPFLALYGVLIHFTNQANLDCSPGIFHVAILCVTVQLLLAAGCVHNDIMDRRIDQINKKNTRVIDRIISFNSAKKIFVVLSLVAIVFSIYISIYIFFEWSYISVGVYLLSLAYNIKLKRSPLFGNILMAALASFIPLIILVFADDCIQLLDNPNLYTLIYLYAWFPFLVIVARELSLDISDLKGDKAEGCRTLPVVIGEKKSKQVVVGILLFIVFLSIYSSLNSPHLLYTWLAVDVLLCVYLWMLRAAKTRVAYIKIGRFLWLVMIMGLIGFTVATLNS